MKSFSKKLITVLILLSSFSIFAQDPSVQVMFKVDGENVDQIYKPKEGDITPDLNLTLGLDENATNGPDIDSFDLPGSPPSLFVQCASQISFVGSDTRVIRDVKHLDDDSLVWHLRLEFGDPEREDCSASNGNIILDWDSAGNPFAADTFTTYTVLLVDFKDIIAGAAPINMKNQTSHEFIFSDKNEIRDVFISMKKKAPDDPNPPVAIDDSVSALTGQTITIDVLNNDFDVDDPNKTNISIAPGDNYNVVDNKIEFTAGNSAGTETIIYSITDDTNLTATATVTVQVNENVVFTRTHDSTASPAEGLLVTIKVDYSSKIDPNADTFILEETFPRFDDALGFWKIPFDSENNPLVGGDNPPNSVEQDEEGALLTTDPPSPVIKFIWEGTLPPSGFSFTYQLTGSDTDLAKKEILGTINGGQPVITTFEIESCTFHQADTNQNWKMDIPEVFRVIDLFNNNLFYAIDNSNTEDGFSPSETQPSAISGFHSADINSNWKIDIPEVFRVIDLFNNNLFYFCAQDENTDDGYIPVDTNPNL